MRNAPEAPALLRCAQLIVFTLFIFQAVTGEPQGRTAKHEISKSNLLGCLLRPSSSLCNNARKFLEIYLYYKYPHGTKDGQGNTHMKNMKKFFGNQSIPAILTNRISNEYSHLAGGFERGAIPVGAPEIVQVATRIIERLREDTDQFDAFLTSIGESGSGAPAAGTPP